VAAGRINTWVSVKTNEKIKEIVSPGSLGEMTRLVLVNAVYFKGAWDRPFKKIHTENRRFYVTPQKEKIVAMMNQLGNFFYMENELVQALELPYEGKDLSMVIVLPKKFDGLAEAEGAFDMEHYKDWMSNLSDREVDVTLPQFKATFEIGLASTLADMGMSEVFSESADLSSMSEDKEGLHASDVLHKAFVDVTEEGTEAAAATAVVMAGKGISLETPSPSAVSFVADHPFLYVIRDRRSDSILFMGRILDPDVGARAVGDVLSGMWSEVVGQALQSQKKALLEARKLEVSGD
jgi:serpin B